MNERELALAVEFMCHLYYADKPELILNHRNRKIVEEFANDTHGTSGIRKTKYNTYQYRLRGEPLLSLLERIQPYIRYNALTTINDLIFKLKAMYREPHATIVSKRRVII